MTMTDSVAIPAGLLKAAETEALGSFSQKIRALFGGRVKGMRLFGSVIRDERWEESDIDLLVLVEGVTWEEKRRVWDESTNVNIQYDTMLSPLVMTPEEFLELRDREKRIALDIDREGIDL